MSVPCVCGKMAFIPPKDAKNYCLCICNILSLSHFIYRKIETHRRAYSLLYGLMPYSSPFDSDRSDETPVVYPSPFGALKIDRSGRIQPEAPLHSGNTPSIFPQSSPWESYEVDRRGRAKSREVHTLQYHYGNDRDHVVMNTDLYEERHTLSCNVSWACVFSACLEGAILAWPITALVIWGFELDTVYSLVFFIHFFKAALLLVKACSNTLVFRMRGRNGYHWFWGIWTRTSHVHQDPLLYIYAILYGWIQIPMMCLFILVSAASYPLYTYTITYWINWPMAIVSLVVGYVAWCVLISERAIRMELERRVPFTHEQRRQRKRKSSRKSTYFPTPNV